MSVRAVDIRVTGTVQGVGFRPTAWRLAGEEGLVGEVLNDGEGVLVRAAGLPDAIDRFVQRLAAEAPPLARIAQIRVHERVEPLVADAFRIVASGGGEVRTQAVPDAAICRACAAEIVDPHARRHGHAFANCTHCGPRYSIIVALPWDRAHTSMAAFEPCAACRREYEDPGDRRHHAQPIACPDCGPRAWFEDWASEDRASGGGRIEGHAAIERVARALREGKIVALRGIGGFHLACDATQAHAVARLRARKQRDAKPLALMVRDIDEVRVHCFVDAIEQQQFESSAAPIVVVRRRAATELPAGVEPLPELLAPRLDALGFMRAYSPLHLLLLHAVARPLVMTSGNLGSEPQAIELADARERLGRLADVALLHEREIVNRIDDSLVRVVAGRPRVIRRARGLAPSPTPLAPSFAAARPLLAFGAEQKATFCLLARGAALLGPHQGDLDEPATFDDYRKHIELQQRLFDQRPQRLACDMHPEYASSRLARARAAAEGLPLVLVQHHHAHVAACMAEHGLELDAPPVLGVALDGLGYAGDGTWWGGELLLADFRGFRRLGSLLPVALPGGTRAIVEPWRNLYAQLRGAIGWDTLQRRYGTLAAIERLAAKPLPAIDRMIDQGLHSPLASSTGRLFDAVAAALGIAFDTLAYPAEAAMQLEAAAARAGTGTRAYPFARRCEGELVRLDPAPMWLALLDDLAAGRDAAEIAAAFHRGLAHAVADLAVELAAGRSDRVVLSGGCMHNALLLAHVSARVEARGLRCLSHVDIPANDGGIALGQAVVAAALDVHERR